MHYQIYIYCYIEGKWRKFLYFAITYSNSFSLVVFILIIYGSIYSFLKNLEKKTKGE